MTLGLDDVGLLLAPTFRSRAYAQTLAAHGMRPALAVLLPGEEPAWDGDETIDFRFGDDRSGIDFHPGVSAKETVTAAGWETVTLDTNDINAERAIETFDKLPVSVLVYSGLSKVLLRPPVLASKVRFLHVHGGYLPAYRGATGFYFGLLNEGRLGVSAIWMDDGIDTGPVLMRDWYDPQSGVEIDRVMEPMARADLLARVLRIRARDGHYPSTAAPGEAGLCFVIHPVLKNIALARAQAVRTKDSSEDVALTS